MFFFQKINQFTMFGKFAIIHNSDPFFKFLTSCFFDISNHGSLHGLFLLLYSCC